MVEVIFIMMSHMNALSTKAVLVVARNVAYPLLFCVYSPYHEVLIPLNSCLPVPYIRDIPHTSQVQEKSCTCVLMPLTVWAHKYEGIIYMSD